MSTVSATNLQKLLSLKTTPFNECHPNKITKTFASLYKLFQQLYSRISEYPTLIVQNRTNMTYINILSVLIRVYDQKIITSKNVYTVEMFLAQLRSLSVSRKHSSRKSTKSAISGLIRTFNDISYEIVKHTITTTNFNTIFQFSHLSGDLVNFSPEDIYDLLSDNFEIVNIIPINLNTYMVSTIDNKELAKFASHIHKTQVTMYNDNDPYTGTFLAHTTTFNPTPQLQTVKHFNWSNKSNTEVMDVITDDYRLTPLTISQVIESNNAYRAAVYV